MTKILVKGINALGEPVKLAKDVATFTDDKHKLSVTIVDISTVRLVTTKGSYLLQKHPTLNIYQGTCNERKVQCSLQKIVGWVGYW
jgi:hypothetical protein